MSNLVATSDPAAGSPASPLRYQLLIFDASPRFVAGQTDGWWTSFTRRSLAFHAQTITTAPFAIHVEFQTIYSAPPLIIEELACFADFQGRNSSRRSQWLLSRGIVEEQITRCFAVIHDWSAAKDAVELVVLHPRPPARSAPSSCGSGQLCMGNIVGARFLISWALEFHADPQHIHHVFLAAQPPQATMLHYRYNQLVYCQTAPNYDDPKHVVVTDDLGVARRLFDENEVPAHRCGHFADSECQRENEVSKAGRAEEAQAAENEDRCTCESHTGSAQISVLAVPIDLRGY
ncbi:hypothetical protein sr15332 [Sporisorium reilianum SRZ2]|uniref:Uncharacterized protein n=1 Tax=Sporisorium reilianum (strain SRZ2) TaxID=999809 RepID=E6ZPV6_SPORE|nr:hypothetical protein sr15332 [Sporisorium reilianum SRZ2]